jgi:hypothetical protein
MIKSGDDIGLMLKTNQKLVMKLTAYGDVWNQYFDGNLARRMQLLSAIYRAHTTLPNEFLEHAGAQYSSFQVIGMVYHHSPLFFSGCAA